MNYIQLIFSLFTSIIIILGTLLNVFENYLPSIFVQTFRYGKFAYSGDKSKLVLEVPKAWFTHFYKVAVFIQTFVLFIVTSTYVFHKEVPNWIISMLDVFCGEDRISFTSVTQVYVSVILITLQVYRRFYDTHYISIFGKNSKINITQYIIGLIHYPLAAVAMICEAPKFAYADPEAIHNVNIFELTALDISVIILFLVAWYHQHVCTKILANLRRNQKGIVVTEEHRLPEGDWFKYLSCPHQTAEILMYFSLTVLLRNNITWAFVFTWVLSNQIETILLSHWWYEGHFEKFPKDRKALIPFVY